MTEQPADIICFAKDWNEPATSVNHVMQELSRRHRVLWINSIAMRNANLGSASDWKKIFRKLRSLFRGTIYISDNLRALTPIVIPLPGKRWAQRINRWLLWTVVRRAARTWGLRHPQLWIFQPNAVEYLGSFDESAVIYYCVDDFSGFSYLKAEFIAQKDRELTARADIIFVTARKLLADKQALNPHVHLIPHGVNQAAFAAALSDNLSVAPELVGLPRPIIGFYGNLYDWVDQDLLAALAKARSGWSFVIIGKIMSDVTTLQQCPNIRLLGPRPYSDLPAYCKGFDVGIIPYKTADPRMQSVNPLKLREYLAAGLPVVSVDLPEVRGVSDDVRIAHNTEEFIRQIEFAVARNSTADRQRRSRAMLEETWTARVETIERHLADLAEVDHV